MNRSYSLLFQDFACLYCIFELVRVVFAVAGALGNTVGDEEEGSLNSTGFS
jgi:hypothetical protein